MIFYFNDFTILLDYVVGWQSRNLFSRFVAMFAKNMALLVQHFWENFSLLQFVFDFFKTKSSDMTTKLEEDHYIIYDLPIIPIIINPTDVVNWANICSQAYGFNIII